MTLDILGNDGAIPRVVAVNHLYLWPGNPRHADENGCRRVPDADIMRPEVQAQCTQGVREADDGFHLVEITASIGSHGLLGNLGAPIAVCSLGSGDFLVVDGNARVVALRDLLNGEGWCRAHAEHAQKLRAGIEVLDFGSWSEQDVRLAVLGHTARIHMGEDHRRRRA